MNRPRIRVQMTAATAPWEERSPKETMQLLGFLCESNLLSVELGAVSSCSVEMFSLERSRPGNDGRLTQR